MTKHLLRGNFRCTALAKLAFSLFVGFKMGEMEAKPRAGACRILWSHLAILVYSVIRHRGRNRENMYTVSQKTRRHSLVHIFTEY